MRLFGRRYLKPWVGMLVLAQEDLPIRDGMMKGLLEGMAQKDHEVTQRFLDESDLSDYLKGHGYWRIARQHLENGGVEDVDSWFSSIGDDHPMGESIGRTTADIFTDGDVGVALGWVGLAAWREVLNALLRSRAMPCGDWCRRTQIRW